MAIFPIKKRKPAKKTLEKPEIDLKASLSLKREARLKKQKILFFLTGAIGFAVLLGLPLGLLFGPEIGIGAGLGLPFLVFCFLYPRIALWIFLIYMPFSGTFTYWVGNGSDVFQLAKDFIYIPALLGLIWQCRQKRLPILIGPKPLRLVFGVLLLSTLLTFLLANIRIQLLPECSEFITTGCRDTEEGAPFLQGLIGLKVFLGYIPLIFCTYYLIEDKNKLIWFGRLLVVLAIICCVLGLIQYWYLDTGRCIGTRNYSADDLFKPKLTAKCLVGGSLLFSPSVGTIRLPGTFVSPWHWGWFLVGNAAICFASAFSDTSKLWRLAGLTGLGLVVINAIICGQRLSFLLVPSLIILLLVLTGKIANLKQLIPIGIGLALVLSLGFSFFNPDFVQQRIDSFVGRWNHAPPYLFIQDQFLFAIRYGGFIGRGIGSATSSARAFGNISFLETYHPKVWFEVGALGFIVYMVFLTTLLYYTFKAYQSLKDPALRSFAASFWVFMLVISYLPYWYPLDTDPVAVYYWLFAGVILRLPELEKQENDKPLENVDNSATTQIKFKRKKFSLA
jgi:hypothetical protein